MTNGSPLADALRERQDEHKEDVYPGLSQLALDSELQLGALTDAPDELSDTDWQDIEKIGARALELLAKPA